MTVSKINFTADISAGHSTILCFKNIWQLFLKNRFLKCLVEQRPWSEWQRSDESCVQHTGLDIEQVQELYDMCEESLKKYRLHRYKQQTDIADRSYLSPMNLLVVTL